MHIVQALDAYEAQHGDLATLPLYMQYASVIYALNRHYGVVAQYAYQEHVFMQRQIIQEVIEKAPPRTLADHKQRFQDTVAWVATFLGQDGRCKVWDGREFHAMENSSWIADYLASLVSINPLANGVTAAHVRAARQRVKRAS